MTEKETCAHFHWRKQHAAGYPGYPIGISAVSSEQDEAAIIFDYDQHEEIIPVDP